jgi:hypothetical protein
MSDDLRKTCHSDVNNAVYPFEVSQVPEFRTETSTVQCREGAYEKVKSISLV